MRKNGFTLSELLLTLGIIGVVSALTIPTLVQNVNQKAFVTTLKKVYSELSQAIQNSMTERNVSEWADARVDSATLLSKYLKSFHKGSTVDVIMSPTFNNVQGNSGSMNISSKNYDCALLKDGAAVCITHGSGPLDFYLDTNGKQGPNIGGRDIFHLYINSAGDIVGFSGYGHIDGHGNSENLINADTAFSKIVDDGWEMKY